MFMAKFLNMEKWKAEESPSQKKKKEKKNKPKEKRKVTILSRKEKYPFVEATGALSWRPDFEQRSHCQTKIFHTWC